MLGKEPAVRADMHATLGTIYRRLGNFNTSEALLNKALAERQQLSGADSADTADVLTRLALLRSDQA